MAQECQPGLQPCRDRQSCADKHNHVAKLNRLRVLASQDRVFPQLCPPVLLQLWFFIWKRMRQDVRGGTWARWWWVSLSQGILRGAVVAGPEGTTSSTCPQWQTGLWWSQKLCLKFRECQERQVGVTATNSQVCQVIAWPESLSVP